MTFVCMFAIVVPFMTFMCKFAIIVPIFDCVLLSVRNCMLMVGILLDDENGRSETKCGSTDHV